MDRLDDGVRCRRQKAVDLMRPRHRIRLRAAITVERRPDAGEGEQRAVVVEREPDDIFYFGLRARFGAYSLGSPETSQSSAAWCTWHPSYRPPTTQSRRFTLFWALAAAFGGHPDVTLKNTFATLSSPASLARS
jgi:hypothetical protein